MTLSLNVDTKAWRAHTRAFADSVPGLVPVAKGNGYGFRNTTLAAEAQHFDGGVIAVGVSREALRILDAGWRGDVVVLNPWRPSDRLGRELLLNPQVITTVSRLEDLASVRSVNPHARVQVELLTSMRRHGIDLDELGLVKLQALGFDGWSIHLPSTGSLDEATGLANAARKYIKAPVWVSHLGVDDYRVLHESLDGQAHMRVGTRLWLGAPSTLATRATVLDMHRVKRGEKLGYHQDRAPKDGWVVIASGGTAHGIALAAPVPQRSLRQRAVTLAEGALDASGRSLSPFSIAGRKRPFAEPPHMHSSMLFVAGGDPLVSIGQEVPVTCRMTTTTFDQIVWR